MREKVQYYVIISFLKERKRQIIQLKLIDIYNVYVHGIDLFIEMQFPSWNVQMLVEKKSHRGQET